MATDSVLQVRMDSKLKREVEELYSKLGISVADAVRMFMVQSLEVQGLPFEVRTGIHNRRTLHVYGIANEYADEPKVAEEKGAWQEAVEKKHR